MLFMNGAPIVVEEWAQRLAVHKGLKVHLTGGRADMVLPNMCSEWVRQYAHAAISRGGVLAAPEAHSP